MDCCRSGMRRFMSRALVLAAFACAVLAFGTSEQAMAVDPVVGASATWPARRRARTTTPATEPRTTAASSYVSDLLTSPVPDAFLPLGDNQYEAGELSELPGRLRADVRARQLRSPTRASATPSTTRRTRRATSTTSAARVCFDRIRCTGGTDATNMETGGYYSFNIGSWHLIALNSNCDFVGGCWDGSPQEQWLQRDLAAHPDMCTLAYWHHPRFNSGTLGNDADTAQFWNDLYDAARRHRPERPRQPPLRAPRAPEPDGSSRTANGDPRVHRQHRRGGPRDPADRRRATRPPSRRATTRASASSSSPCARTATTGSSCPRWAAASPTPEPGHATPAGCSRRRLRR